MNLINRQYSHCPLPSMKSVDPLVELIRQLHEQAGNSDVISLEEAKKLLEDCDFEDGLRQHVIEEFNFGSAGVGPIKTEHFLRKVKEAEKFYGKQRHAEPILANLKLMSDFSNPWSGKLAGAESSGQSSKPATLTAFKGSGDDAASSFTIDLDCIHISIQDVSGAVFKHVNYKLELCYGVYGGGEHYSNSVTTRRYSDFSWLHSYLSSKFPFRAVPTIPAKKFVAPTAAAELELANDRHLHLNSFLICLLMHPIFAKDNAVRAFFSDPRCFSDWTLNNPDADITEEYKVHEKVIQEPEDDVELSSENLVNAMLPDDPLFRESSSNLELLGDVLKNSMECAQNIYKSYGNIADGSRLMLNQFSLVESMYSNDAIAEIHLSLAEIVRNNEEKVHQNFETANILNYCISSMN